MPNLTLSNFLGAFFPDENETIHFRAFKAKGAPDAPDKRPRNLDVTRHKLATDKNLQKILQRANKQNGVYFVVNAGGSNDAAITRFNSFFCESDTATIAAQHAALDAAPLLPSIRVETRKSVHAYWLLSGTCSEADWRDMQLRLIDFFNGDGQIKNPARVMRVPFFQHVLWNGAGYEYKNVKVPQFETDRRHTVAQMQNAYPPAELESRRTPDNAHTGHGHAHNGLFTTYEARHAELTRRIMARGKLNSSGNYDAVCLAHKGNSSTGLFFNPTNGAVKCLKGVCDYNALLRADGLRDGHLPQYATGPGTAANPTTQGVLRIVRMADVAPETVAWLWHPYLPLGKLTLLEGDGGLGKSWLTCALATAVSLGRGLPETAPFTPGNVLMLSAEDGLGDTLRPRLDSFGADLSRIFALAEPLTLDTVGLLRLQAAIAEHSPHLVVIDPLFAYTGGKMDIHRANEARSFTAPLGDIAAKFGCAIIAVRHLAKSRGMGHAANAGIGSIDFYAAARSVLMVGADPDDQRNRAMVQTKNNLAALGEAIGFTIEGGAFFWTGASALTAERLLALPGNDTQRANNANAADVLRDLLAPGPMPAAEAQKEMKQAGCTAYAIRQAQATLGIKSFRKGFGANGVWTWALPPAPEGRIDVENTPIDVETNNIRHLWVNEDNKASCSNGLPIDVEPPFFFDIYGRGFDIYGR